MTLQYFSSASFDVDALSVYVWSRRKSDRVFWAINQSVKIDCLVLRQLWKKREKSDKRKSGLTWHAKHNRQRFRREKTKNRILVIRRGIFMVYSNHTWNQTDHEDTTIFGTRSTFFSWNGSLLFVFAAFFSFFTPAIYEESKTWVGVEGRKGRREEGNMLLWLLASSFESYTFSKAFSLSS